MTASSRSAFVKLPLIFLLFLKVDFTNIYNNIFDYYISNKCGTFEPVVHWSLDHVVQRSHKQPFLHFRSSSSNSQYFSTFRFLAISNNRCALRTNRRNFFCLVFCLCIKLQVLALKFTFFDQILNPDISQKPCERIQLMSITKCFLIISNQ